MKPLYHAVVKSKGGREGHVKSTDGFIDMAVAMPKELGGKGGATNPEQLFAAGYSACFESAMQHLARSQKLQLRESEVQATVSIGPNQEGAFMLAVKLEVHLPGLERSVAEKLMHDAHQVCPYSNASRNNIEVELNLR